MNRFKEIREKKDISQNELARIFLDNNYISYYETYQKAQKKVQVAISRLEEKDFNQTPTIGTELIPAYCKYFNVTSDYLLNIRESAIVNENYAMIGKITGLTDEAIETLKTEKKNMKEGNQTYHIIEMINFLLENNDTKLLVSDMYEYFFGNYIETDVHGEYSVSIYDACRNGIDIPINKICSVFLSKITESMPLIKNNIIQNNPKYFEYGKSAPCIEYLDEEIPYTEEYIKELIERGQYEMVKPQENKLNILKYYKKIYDPK